MLVIDRTGGIFQMTPHRILNGEDLLRNIAQTRPMSVPNLYADPSIRVQVSPSGLTIGKEIPFVNLNTHFAPITFPDNQVRIVPTFYATPVSTVQTIKFTPPPGHYLHFFLHRPLSAPRPGERHTQCYLVWEHRGQGLFIPPFNNIYADTRICMGDHYVDGGNSLIENLDHAIEWYQTTRSNTDLAGTTRTDFPVRFHPESDEPDHAPFANGVRNVLTAASNHLYDTLFTPVAMSATGAVMGDEDEE